MTKTYSPELLREYSSFKAFRCAETHTKHGLYMSSEYRSWQSMKRRCYAKTHRSYHNYGGRGIKVCARWKNSFSNFILDIGRKPSPAHSLERINNNRGYYPKNCRWAIKSEQCRNMRVNRKITHLGKTMIIADWAKLCGVHRRTLYDRVKMGIPFSRAINPRHLRAPADGSQLRNIKKTMLTVFHYTPSLRRANRGLSINKTLPRRAAGCSSNFSTEICTGCGGRFVGGFMPKGDGKTLFERFSLKIQKDEKTGCWNWMGSIKTNGYGQFGHANHGSGETAAHRYAYIFRHGPIPDGLYVCHHCDNRRCCNPQHLFLGTAKDNALDAKAKGRSSRANSKLTHCKRGHEFNPVNTLIKTTETGIKRFCRLCDRLRPARKKKRKHAKSIL